MYSSSEKMSGISDRSAKGVWEDVGNYWQIWGPHLVPETSHIYDHPSEVQDIAKSVNASLCGALEVPGIPWAKHKKKWHKSTTNVYFWHKILPAPDPSLVPSLTIVLFFEHTKPIRFNIKWETKQKHGRGGPAPPQNPPFTRGGLQPHGGRNRLLFGENNPLSRAYKTYQIQYQIEN